MIRNSNRSSKFSLSPDAIGAMTPHCRRQKALALLLLLLVVLPTARPVRAADDKGQRAAAEARRQAEYQRQRELNADAALRSRLQQQRESSRQQMLQQDRANRQRWENQQRRQFEQERQRRSSQ
jgi:hypothetical protein